MTENPLKQLRVLARSVRKQRVINLPPGRLWSWIEGLLDKGYLVQRTAENSILARRGSRRIKICH